MESLIYGLECNARSLTSQQDCDEIRFFVGSQIINGKNQIHMVDLQEESNQLSVKIFNHLHGEVWGLSSSCNDRVIASVYTSAHKRSSELLMQSAILRIPEPEDLMDPSKELLDFADIEVLDTEPHGNVIFCTEFHPSSKELLASVVDGKILLFNRTESKSVIVAEIVGKKLFGGMFSGANQFVSIQETGIKSYDIRDSNHIAWQIDDAGPVRVIDVNTNKAFHLATGGDDGILKIFDVRKNKEPVFSTGLHQHWIFSVSFNKFHDQLLLTSSSDGKVLLTCASTCSSEFQSSPNHNNNEFHDVKKSPLTDGLLETLSEHEESVYSSCWSMVDPWTFASLSYDGRLIITRIPKKYKYQIIL